MRHRKSRTGKLRTNMQRWKMQECDMRETTLYGTARNILVYYGTESKG